MPADTLTITDNRTGKTYEIPICDETIRAVDLRKIRAHDEDFGLMTYDPAYMNTASCKSTITFIDGDKGILNYRGYPIEQLADHGSYLETAYLLWNGQLPNAAQLAEFTATINANLALPENFGRIYDGFGRDAHPMSLLMAGFAGMASAYPDAKHVLDKESRTKQIYRGLAQAMTLGAWGYRFRKGLPMVEPHPELSFAGNFLYMLFEKEADPRSGSGGGHSLHPACRPRAELLDVDDAAGGQFAGRSVFVAGGGFGGVVWSAAWRRE